MSKSTTLKEARYDHIIAELKSGRFNVKQSAETLGVNRSTITEDLKTLQLMYPEIKHVGSRGAASKWYWEEAGFRNVPYSGSEAESIISKVASMSSDEIDEKRDAVLMGPNRYPDSKTEEGYPDPTAAAALQKTDIYGTRQPGEVWAVSSANGTVEEYLVIKDFKGCCSCLMVCKDTNLYNKSYCVPIDLQSKSYVDVRRIVSKPTKYFLEKRFDIKNFDAVKRKIVLVMDFSIDEKIVEKEVIKEVPVVKEVVKEVIKEVPVEKSVDTVEMALLKQKADIYEKIAWAFLNWGGDVE